MRSFTSSTPSKRPPITKKLTVERVGDLVFEVIEGKIDGEGAETPIAGADEFSISELAGGSVFVAIEGKFDGEGAGTPVIGADEFSISEIDDEFVYVDAGGKTFRKGK